MTCLGSFRDKSGYNQSGGTMKIKPLFDRVLLKLSTQENRTESGFMLPETAPNKPEIALVVAVGDGTNLDGKEIKMKVKVGDKVLFNRYNADEVKFDDTVYYILREIDILGVMDD